MTSDHRYVFLSQLDGTSKETEAKDALEVFNLQARSLMKIHAALNSVKKDFESEKNELQKVWAWGLGWTGHCSAQLLWFPYLTVFPVQVCFLIATDTESPLALDDGQELHYYMTTLHVSFCGVSTVTELKCFWWWNDWFNSALEMYCHHIGRLRRLRGKKKVQERPKK